MTAKVKIDRAGRMVLPKPVRDRMQLLGCAAKCSAQSILTWNL
jgi:hypothetical protein